jgi:hypothetical protein
MLKLKFSSVYLIAFVALAVLLMTMLPSSCGCCREGLENPDSSSSPLPPPGPSIPEIDTRLTALEKSVNESKDKIAMGEAKANAAVGNLQMTLPA